MAPTTFTSIPTGLTSSKTGTFYLAFGSNLSPTQMRGVSPLSQASNYSEIKTLFIYPISSMIFVLVQELHRSEIH
jgi:hypothetical protein